MLFSKRFKSQKRSPPFEPRSGYWRLDPSTPMINDNLHRSLAEEEFEDPDRIGNSICASLKKTQKD